MSDFTRDPSGPPGDDDVVEARLRRALNSEASMVQPAGDGLQRIRGGIDERSGHAWWRNPAFALVAAALVGLAAGGLFFGLGGDDGSTQVSNHSDSATPTRSVSDSGTPTSSTSDSSTPDPSDSASACCATAKPGRTNVQTYVYFVHDDGQSLRLYREEHLVSGRGSNAKLAVQRMLRGTPDDPDYSSPWNGARLLHYRKAGDTATVDLSGFVAVGSAAEEVATQEIVYTVTANDTSVRQVRLLVNGATPQSGVLDLSQPVTRAPMVNVQGLIWILAPKQGATVGSPVQIDGSGTATEGTISWEVRQDGVVVEQGFTQGGSNGTFAEFHDTVDLAPGDYEIRAFENSGQDGSPIHVDTKSFTVR